MTAPPTHKGEKLPPEPLTACQCQCGLVGCASHLGGQHGTKYRYANGCRCDDCVAANTAVDRRRFIATSQGVKRGQRWTGAEMELALREDLTVEELARLLGRTYQAVVVMRNRCRTEPKYIQAAGVAHERTR